MIKPDSGKWSISIFLKTHHPSHAPVHDEFYISPIFKRRKDTQLCLDLVFIIDVYRLWAAIGIEYHEIRRLAEYRMEVMKLEEKKKDRD